MELSAALEMWLGGLEEPCDDARCLFLGAGFTKACNDDAALFKHYVAPLRAGLRRASPGLLPRHLVEQLADPKSWLEPSDLVELYDQVFGRRAVAELILSEPPEDAFALHGFGQIPFLQEPPPFLDSVFRTLKQWKRVLAAQPAHLAALDPAGPAVLLGRLVAERVVPLVLSTNWDAYVELGCWLAGLHVADVEKPVLEEQPSGRLVVYDRPEEVALHARHDGHPHLLKLHGGVDGIAKILQGAAEGRLNQEAINARLTRSFLVATSDLTHWRDSSQWVQDAASDALRSHRTLFLGVSGADPVTFRATRARIAEWERYADEHRRLLEIQSEVPTVKLPRRPPLAAIDFGPTPRLYGMLAVRRSSGVDYPVVKAGGRRSLRATYAWFLGRKLLGALDKSKKEDCKIRDRLQMRLEREVEHDAGPTPLVDVLCDALGPSARWAAIAEARPPFDERAFRPEHRWRYAPWFAAPPGLPIADRANLREIAACAVALSQAGQKDTTDAWSGVVHVPDDHPSGAPLAGADILPLPWPWPATTGFASRALLAAIGDRFLWISGRARTHLASPRLLVAPVGEVRDMPDEIVIAGAAARVKRFDWFKEATK